MTKICQFCFERPAVFGLPHADSDYLLPACAACVERELRVQIDYHKTH